MKRRRFTSASARQRSNADLFFADLMGPPSLRPAGASQARLQADRFLADLLGERAYPLRGLAHDSPAGSPRPMSKSNSRMTFAGVGDVVNRDSTYAGRAVPLAEPQVVAPAGQMHNAPSEDDWGESGSCPDRDEVVETWQALSELRKLMDTDRKKIDSNPLVIEVQMLKQLMDVLDMAKEVPSKVWGEIWDELKAFASGDVKPLVARVKAGEKHANAVLRVLHGLTSILQGYVHDRIDAGFKSKLDAQKGWSKAAAKLLIHVIKKQVPVIRREIKADNFAAVAKAFEDLRTQLEGQGFSVTGVWNVIVALGKEIIGNAIDDAAKNTARWAVKKAGKKLLGSAAKAASVIFILEDIALLVHALVTISNYKQWLREFNRVLLGFLARVRPCDAASPGGKYTTWVKWKRAPARVDCQVVLQSFAAKKGGKPGEGEWHKAPLKTTLDGKSSDLPVRIDVPATERAGQRVLRFQLPPVAQWPAKGDSFVSVEFTEFGAAGNVLETSSLFVAACVP